MTSPETDKKRSGCVRGLIILTQFALVGVLIVILGGIEIYVCSSVQLADAIDKVSVYQEQGAGGTPRFFGRNGKLLFE